MKAISIIVVLFGLVLSGPTLLSHYGKADKQCPVRPRVVL